jgi:small conductance mechanosensitive channel
MTSSASTPAAAPKSWAVLEATGLLVGLAVVGVVLYSLVLHYGLIPTSDAEYARVGLVIGLGVVGVIVVGRIVFSLARRFAGHRHAALILDVYRIVAYTVLALVILYSLGINGYALLAGGTFAGLVIGLASQTALSNLVAGVVLLVSRPFLPGDRITLTTWQFGLLLPSYPPKFFSQDLLFAGFTGSVVDIGLMYTTVSLDDGPTGAFPNSIVIQGAIVSHNVSERWVRVKYDVPPTVDPRLVIERVKAAVTADEWVVGKTSVRVQINQATQASYIISVDALCAGNHEEAPRSALYLRIMETVASLPRSGSAPPPASGPPSSSSRTLGPPTDVPRSGTGSATPVGPV